MDLRASLTALGRFAQRPLSLHVTCLVTLSCVATLALGQVALDHFAPRITISDSYGLVRTVRCTGTVADALRLAHVEVGPHDALSAPLQMLIPNLHRIHIRRAIPVTITTATGDFQLLTVASDISDLKSDPRLAMSPLDRFWPRSGTPIVPGMKIKLARVTTTESSIERPLANSVDFIHDPALPRGATALVSKGKPGLQEVRLIEYFKDGVYTGTQELAGTILKAAIPEVRKIGVRALTIGRAARGNRMLIMEATAYEPGPRSCGIYASGFTATGRRATYGVCAVDPRVIPLGTRLFIEGYGIAVAADVGGAIKGLKIDVCYDTVAEALRWGRRQAKVYILDEFSGTIPIVDKAGKTQKIVAVSMPSGAKQPRVVITEVPIKVADPTPLLPFDLDAPAPAPPKTPAHAATPPARAQDTTPAATPAPVEPAPLDLLPAPVNLLPIAEDDAA